MSRYEGKEERKDNTEGRRLEEVLEELSTSSSRTVCRRISRACGKYGRDW